MNPSVLISVCLGILVGLIVAVAVAVAAARSWRKVRSRHCASLADPLRTSLIELATGDDDGSLAEWFVGLPAREWRAVCPQMIELCRKLDVASTGSLRSVLTERGVLDRAIRDTRRRSAVRRAWAAMLLELFPTVESRSALLELLGDRDSDVRRMAVRGIGAIGDAACVRPVIGLLHGSNRVASASVGHSLILLGSIAVDELVVTVRTHPDESVVVCCVEVLGHVGDPRAVTCLVDALRATSNPDRLRVRVAAAQALGRLGSPKGIGGLIEGLKGESSELAVACIDALVGVGSAHAVPHITATLYSVDAPVAAAAAVALPKLGDVGVDALRSNAAAGDLAVVEAVSLLSARERHGLRTRVRVGA